MTRLKRYSFAFLVAVALITSCAPSPQAVPENPTLTPLPSLTLTPTETMVPRDFSSVPGFEDWSVLNAPAVDVAAEDNALILTLKHRALWFMNQRGVLASTLIDGDFRITADVYTSKSSDISQPPGGDGTVQLGGIMARNGNGGRENYIFIVVGDDGDGPSIETKNTTDNVSEYDGPAWDASNAQLRICRVGSTFTLYKRHVGTEEAWIQAASFDRPDLPARVQVGVNIYSDSTPDLQVRYENIEIENIPSTSACETD